MGMFADIGGSWGAMFGSRRAAKGYDKAEEIWNDFDKYADQTRDYIDPNAKYRKGYGKTLNDLMTGKMQYEETAAHKTATEYGLKHMARQQAASGFGTGLASSGNAATALTKYSSDMAMRGYNDMLDRLTNLGAAGQATAIAGGQAYGQMQTARAEGRASSKIGKYGQLGQADVAGHRAIGQSIDVASSFMSDARLKKNIKRVGKDGELFRYKWQWNQLAEEKFGLTGEDEGYIAQEVKKVMPEAVTTIRGYQAIDYGYLNELREAS